MVDDICRDFVRGVCTRLSGNCKFKHPESENKPICKDFLRGNCSYREKCRFKHPAVCKDQICNRKSCKFFHSSENGEFDRSNIRTRRSNPFDGPPPPTFDRRDSFYDRRTPSPSDIFKRRAPDDDLISENICRDYIRGDCDRIRCNYLHELPNKRRRSMGDPMRSPRFSNRDRHWGGHDVSGPLLSERNSGLVVELESKLRRYEDKIKDLEKRCAQYEDFNKLLTERNDELKSKVALLTNNTSQGGYSYNSSGGSASGGYQSPGSYSRSGGYF